MRVLIADDDLTSQNILSYLLRKWGFDLLIANDGQAAWDVLLQPDAPALLILDWTMPGIDGVELIRRVRAKFVEQPPYIIMITGRGNKGDIITGLEAGANDYIKKPFESDELFARIRVGQRSVELQASNYESKQLLARLAIYDVLTGVLNRRGILEQLSRELARAKRNRSSGEKEMPGKSHGLCLGFIDLDRFKPINDQYGHQVGDEVLNGVAGMITEQLRPYDFVGRLGGDEFLVIAPDAGGENSNRLFERLAAVFAEHPIITSAGELSVSMSIGVVSVDLNMEMDHILDIADKTMYKAKDKGGNFVMYWHS